MDLWIWIVLVAAVVVLAAVLFAWIRTRQRSGSVRAARGRGDRT